MTQILVETTGNTGGTFLLTVMHFKPGQIPGVKGFWYIVLLCTLNLDRFLELKEDVVEFKGRYYEIPASRIGPKPIQKPRIPIYLAGFSPNTFSRVVKYAEGWLPSADRLDFFEHLTNGIKKLKEQGKREKRNLEIITLTFPFHADSHKEDGTGRPPFGGTVDEVRIDLRRLKEMGVDHAILQLTEPDLNRVIDTAKQVSKSVK